MHDRAIYNSDHELFRANARRFFRDELEPNIDEWEECLNFATKAAAINCTKEGCYPPGENEIRNFKLPQK